MKKLGKRNYELIADSMRTLGFNEPWDGMMNEEQMYCSEIEEIVEFLTWLYEIDRPFGQANYEQRFAEFKSGEKPPKSWFEVHVNFPGKAPKNLVGGKGLHWPDHQHIKRISANHTDKLQIAARLCSNLDDPNWLKVVEVGGTYEKKYDLKEMKKFVKDHVKEIREIRNEGYDKFPSEFY